MNTLRSSDSVQSINWSLNVFWLCCSFAIIFWLEFVVRHDNRWFTKASLRRVAFALAQHIIWSLVFEFYDLVAYISIMFELQFMREWVGVIIISWVIATSLWPLLSVEIITCFVKFVWYVSSSLIGFIVLLVKQVYGSGWMYAGTVTF